MDVQLVDGTYELFRQYFGQPPRQSADGREVGAVRGVLVSLMAMLADGATHMGVATDHVVESFRNDLWPGYKTGAGIEPELASQFGLLETALQAFGLVVWPMVELEADDALASAASVAAADPTVDRVLICTPDKDLAQCVVDQRVVQLDRRKGVVTDEDGVWEKFGVAPRSIPFVASHMRWEDTRLSSTISIRIQSERGGISTPSRASTASERTSSLWSGER